MKFPSAGICILLSKIWNHVKEGYCESTRKSHQNLLRMSIFLIIISLLSMAVMANYHILTGASSTPGGSPTSQEYAIEASTYQVCPCSSGGRSYAISKGRICHGEDVYERFTILKAVGTPCSACGEGPLVFKFIQHCDVPRERCENGECVSTTISTPPPPPPPTPKAATSTAKKDVCGNGELDPGEECDDGSEVEYEKKAIYEIMDTEQEESPAEVQELVAKYKKEATKNGDALCAAQKKGNRCRECKCVTDSIIIGTDIAYDATMCGNGVFEVGTGKGSGYEECDDSTPDGDGGLNCRADEKCVQCKCVKESTTQEPSFGTFLGANKITRSQPSEERTLGISRGYSEIGNGRSDSSLNSGGNQKGFARSTGYAFAAEPGSAIGIIGIFLVVLIMFYAYKKK